MDAAGLERRLRAYRDRGPANLLSLLGFEPVGFRIPNEALSAFGLDAGEALTLELAARHGEFQILRIGLPFPLAADAIDRAAAALYRHNPARRALLLFEAAGDQRLVLASWGLGPGPLRLRRLWIDRTAPRAAELDILAALAVDGVATSSDIALAHCRALDREAVTRRFFNAFRRCRAELATSLIGMPTDSQQDRLDFALLLLSRLLFLYFIQRKGWLAGDPAYLRHLYEDALRTGKPFFRRPLRHLLFGALNRPPASRSAAARSLGDLPYLNGGLFERDVLERKYPSLNVPDEAFTPIFYSLLDRYQFTLREDSTGDHDVAIDPEMLGKVFEGLMSEPLRGATGAYYTPRSIVDNLVCETLSAHLASVRGCDRELILEILGGGSPPIENNVREQLRARVKTLRVLDPAVGSGAFLLAALQRLEDLREYLDGPAASPLNRFERRQEIIGHNLFGVDLNGAAVRLCELRLWLALIVDLEIDSVASVPPLPNLDLNVRQGDALVDPIDFLAQQADLDYGMLNARWRREFDRLARRRSRYFHASGRRKRQAERAVRRSERDLAAGLLGVVRAQLDERRRDIQAVARGRDLFGRRAGLDRRQRAAAASLRRRRKEVSKLLRRLRESDQLPFFSFPVHFGPPESGDPSFDVILGNPPWVRTHHWSGLSRQRLRERFACLRDAGWRRGSRLAGAGRGFGAQLDLSGLFLERSLDLLTENGTLGFLLPAKLLRGLSAGALRKRMLNTTEILQLEDCSSATNPLFAATNYPLAILLRQRTPGDDRRLFVRLHDRLGGALEFQLSQRDLSLLPDDPESPWALVPPSVQAALGRMQAAGPPLGSLPLRRPLRGIFTGNNDVYLGEILDPRPIDGCLKVSLAGKEESIEVERLRPALRGADLLPWRYSPSRILLWTHDDQGQPLAKLPPATARYLASKAPSLRARVDLRAGQPTWTIFRARPQKWSLRVAWRDIGVEPCAVVVPARVPFLGGAAAVISLNTVYQIAASSDEEAHLLAAVLNSTVARAYLKTIAERAAGGHFRFLGWTVALLPFPISPDPSARVRCVELSRTAHRQRGLRPSQSRELDEQIGRLYRLAPSLIEALLDFDARLGPRTTAPARR